MRRSIDNVLKAVIQQCLFKLAAVDQDYVRPLPRGEDIFRNKAGTSRLNSLVILYHDAKLPVR